MSPKLNSKEQNFEKALEKLEGIIEEMEQGELKLDAMIKKFEEGTKLAGFCTKKLEEAEKKIEIITREKDGTVTTAPFSPAAEEKQEKPKTQKNKTATGGRTTEPDLF